MQDALAELDQAVSDQDAIAARALLADLPASDDGVLQHLATLAASGSSLATELLIERIDEAGLVRKFARGSLFDQAAVDDVCQDSLISIAGSIGSFQGQSAVTTWIHRIVKNRVVDHLRRQRSAEPLPEDDVGPAQRMSSMIATRTTVQQAVADLPDLYRDPVTLRDLEDLPYAEIADRLDRSLGTIKSQVARGRALVAAALRDPGHGGP